MERPAEKYGLATGAEIMECQGKRKSGGIRICRLSRKEPASCRGKGIPGF
jgi:hypothetical protein